MATSIEPTPDAQRDAPLDVTAQSPTISADEPLGEVLPAEGEAAPQAIGLSMSLLEHTQDAVSTIVGMVLIGLSAALLVAGIYSFFDHLSSLPLVQNASDLLDQVLLVLILVEIVHTVVLSVRAHTLVPQPFIVVGLVAAIRKLLFVLGNQLKISTTQLALYIAMVAVFVASLVAISWISSRSRSPGP